jgi:hypothetical protein
VKFGIVTPVFDGCLGSLELLFRQIRRQTHGDWSWFLCSNGPSKKIARFVRNKNNTLNRRRRTALSQSTGLVCLHTEYEEFQDAFGLLANVGKRRNHCIEKLETDYVLLIDADARIIDSRMFETINSELEARPSDICIYKIKFSEEQELPVFPIAYGTIDTLNYCVSARLAKEVGYPTTVRKNREQYGNDFWFLDRCLKESNGNYTFIDKLFGQYNGNNTYLNLQTLIKHPDINKIRIGLARSLKVILYRSLLNPLGL